MWLSYRITCQAAATTLLGLGRMRAGVSRPDTVRFSYRFNAALISISVNGVWCHIAFAKDRKLHFPLLADFEPKGTVARTYGAYRRRDGVCERALFVIDAEGTIR
jgi:peroxiredoxin